MPTQGAISRLAKVSADQWGLVTRQQATNAGVAPATLARMIKSGVLERIAHGIYLMAGSPRPDHAELRAAWLQLAPTLLRGTARASKGWCHTDPRLRST